jgi:hypothetical protein
MPAENVFFLFYLLILYSLHRFGPLFQIVRTKRAASLFFRPTIRGHVSKSGGSIDIFKAFFNSNLLQ